VLTESGIKVAQEIATKFYKNTDRLSYGKGISEFVQELTQYAEARAGVTKEQRAQWLRDKWNSNEFAAAVKFAVNKDVLAQMFALAFFQLVSLADDEWPIIETMQRDGKFRVSSIGEANGKPKRQFVDRRTHLQHLLERFATEWVEYQLIDLQVGNVSAADRVANELSYEFTLGIDKIARTLLNANYVTSGLRSKLNLHKEIVSANIPDTNYLDFTGVGGSGFNGKITLEKMKRLLEHFLLFASDVELDGAPLQLQTMFISSKNQRDLWDFAEVVAGYNLSGAIQDGKDVVPGAAKLEIWRSGKLDSLFGQSFATITRNTIAHGDALAASNKPVGYYFEKPGMAMTGRKEESEDNKGRMNMSKVHAFVLPEPWMYRFGKVKW